MLSKRGIRISREKTWFDSAVQPEIYNGWLFQDFGGKAPIRRRLEVGKQRSQPSKVCTFLQKLRNLGLL